MDVILLTTFRASRKDPLAGVLERIQTAFLESPIGEPEIAFAFADAPLPGFVSSVDRVLKRYPELKTFECTFSAMPGLPAVRQLSNRAGTPAEGQRLPFTTLATIAGGVPRSFPFHNISIHFKSPAFGVALPMLGPMGSVAPGILVGDSWWVNGRNRSVSAVTSVKATAASKKLPPHPPEVASILAACGKAQKTVQVPLASATDAAPATQNAPESAHAAAAVVRDFKSRLAEIMERAAMPHDLPPAGEVLASVSLAEGSGPKKPALVAAFSPLGYSCRGESGTFTLRRRTATTLTVDVELDVGTWSNSLTGFYSVTGLGFHAVLPLPASQRAGPGQYFIGGPGRWQKIVENLAALVTELDRTFVPAIETAVGTSPEWYKPET